MIGDIAPYIFIPKIEILVVASPYIHNQTFVRMSAACYVSICSEISHRYSRTLWWLHLRKKNSLALVDTFMAS